MTDMARYYDLVLGLIPLAFGTIAVALTVLGFTLTTAVPAASLVAVGLVGHAMFVNGPVDADSAGSGANTSASHQPAD